MQLFLYGLLANDHKWYLIIYEYHRIIGNSKWILRTNAGDFYVTKLKSKGVYIDYREIKSIEDFLGNSIMATRNPKGASSWEDADFQTATIIQLIKFS